ncbi:MAG: hypothetical protein M5U26_04700 [Planctomycetota bacterium]|nr:hypothetical protein [Planctomycetota bacterium]
MPPPLKEPAPEPAEPPPPKPEPRPAEPPPTPKVPQPAPDPDPPLEQPKPPKPVASLEQLAGSFQYKPNPLVTEKLVLKADGSFEYRDSNGAQVAGQAAFEGGVLKLQAGEVVRQLSAKLEGGALVLTRTSGDRPKILNDLATMSPSVLETARYEKN